MWIKGSSLTSQSSSTVPAKSANSGSTPEDRQTQVKKMSCTTGLGFPKASRTELQSQEFTDPTNNTYMALDQKRYRTLLGCWGQWGTDQTLVQREDGGAVQLSLHGVNEDAQKTGERSGGGGEKGGGGEEGEGEEAGNVRSKILRGESDQKTCTSKTFPSKHFFFLNKRSEQHPQSSPLPLARSSNSKKGRPILALSRVSWPTKGILARKQDRASPGDWQEAGGPRAAGSLAAETTPHAQAPPRVPAPCASAPPLAQPNAHSGNLSPLPAPTQDATDCRSSPRGRSSALKSPLLIPSPSQAAGGGPQPFPIPTARRGKPGPL